MGCQPNPEVEVECAAAADCSPRDQALCNSCSAAISAACIAGACSALAEQAYPLSADVMLQLSLTGQVLSVVYAVIDPRSARAGDSELSCNDLVTQQVRATDGALNVVASSFVNFNATQGTALFPNCNFGIVPVGRYILFASGFDQQRGEGTEVGRGCTGDLLIESSAVKTNLQMNSID